MNTSSLKTFAQNARNKLRAQVTARLNYWLGAEGGTAPDTAAHRQFAPQIKELAEALKKEGRDGLVERISYTWFNRLAALRFMDANDFHPFGVRVVTPASENEILPALLQQARAGALNAEIRAKLANTQAFDDILAGRIPVAHPETELFGMLLLAACNYYHAVMPFLFEKLGDATQLLLPEDLLSEQSILTDIRENLTDEDCTEVEVIGWLYQFYISEKKAEVDGRKTAVPKEDIPAVTQLFTPHWIVRYLVENSLGRLWLLNRPHSRLRGQMPYYIEGEPETDFLKIAKPEDIKLVDPACGSGHMLTYAFDLLYLIYEEEGYDAPEISTLILQHNLFGLEICDRAAALAAFALCMKARAKDRRFFKRIANSGAVALRPHIIELQEVCFADGELPAYFNAIVSQPSAIHPQLTKLLGQFEDAKNLGSLIQPCLDEQAIATAQCAIEEKELSDPALHYKTHAKVHLVLSQAKALTQRYHVVVSNPPYQERDNMNPHLKKYVDHNFSAASTDLCCAFILRNQTASLTGGCVAMITMQSWMFLDGSVDLRKRLLPAMGLLSMLHLGPHAFDSIPGEIVQTTAFVYGASPRSRHPTFHRLVTGKNEEEKRKMLLAGDYRFANRSLIDLQEIPGSPLAYWASDAAIKAFDSFPALASVAEPRQGLITGETARFLRYWHEVDLNNLGLNQTDRTASRISCKKWFPQDKGGPPRRWYGNNDFVVNWLNDGNEIRNFKSPTGRLKSRPQNLDYYFRSGVTWTKISSGSFAARFTDTGFIFSDAGMKVFHADKDELLHIAGFLNSRVANQLLGCLSETINYEQGNIARLPVAPVGGIAAIAGPLIDLARIDWDNFETSWDFRGQPLLLPGLKGSTLEASWRNWETQSTAAIRRMQELETENNRLFIAAYGLEGELQPEVPEAQITLARADRRTDMAAFFSYAVGCMMGRYSLDKPGLILANAGAHVEDYRAKVPNSTFAPDEDGILPVLDDEWFSDDIVGRFREFLRITFDEESFVANLRFIEESLGKPEAKTGKIKPTEIRSYFVSEFYKNHISTERAYGYKKRPIYWMVSSPNGSFQALIYLHRYTRDTLNRMLDGYVRPFLDKLEQRQQACTVISNDAAAKPAARTAAAKELLKLGTMLKEIREWERDTLLPLAQKRIELDLDDGVKVNYLKFKGILVPIAGLEKKEED